MKAAIQNEIMELPLPASLSSVALTLLNSDSIWIAYDDDDFDDAPTGNNSDSGSNSENDDCNDLSKYMEGMTIQSTMQQKQSRKLQFDTICNEFMSRGNHVILNSWEDVENVLREEFSFLSGGGVGGANLTMIWFN